MGRAHVSQAVRGFPGMSLVANYLRQTENKTGFWAVQISLLFLGFYDRQQVGNVQVKGVCTLLISFSLFLSFSLIVFFAKHSPLHLACISGFVDVVAALIRMAPHPCLLNIQNDVAQTPLHLAALTVQPTILRMLLLAGAEVSLF